MVSAKVPFRFFYYLAADLKRAAFLMELNASSPWTFFKVFFTPRFVPVFLCRLAHFFYLVGIKPFAKLVSLLNFLIFGIEIASRCEIGPGLYFPHTQGIVIGALSIGSNATIYHGVTLGALEVNFAYSSAMRPTIGNNVLIGSGAKILGGITVGDNVRVGANAVVLDSVPSNTLAVGVPAKIIEK